MKSRDFYRHKSEVFLFVLSVIASLVVFIFLSYLGYSVTLGKGDSNLILQILQLDSDMATTVVAVGGYLSIIVIIFTLLRVLMAYAEFSMKAKANDIHITKKQLPVLIEAEKEYAKKLGIKNLPTLFLSVEKDELNVLEINVISNPSVIRIPCEEVIATAENGYYGAKFTIAKHLAYIYMGYYNPILFILTLFARWIPILNHAYYRAMTYTVDKIAAELVGKKEAISSIVEQTIDIWVIPYISVDEFIENTKNVVNDKDMIWMNMLSYEPIAAYRIDALLNDKDGKLF